MLTAKGLPWKLRLHDLCGFGQITSLSLCCDTEIHHLAWEAFKRIKLGSMCQTSTQSLDAALWSWLEGTHSEWQRDGLGSFHCVLCSWNIFSCLFGVLKKPFHHFLPKRLNFADVIFQCFFLLTSQNIFKKKRVTTMYYYLYHHNHKEGITATKKGRV
jgi:hypothetical protein